MGRYRLSYYTQPESGHSTLTYHNPDHALTHSPPIPKTSNTHPEYAGFPAGNRYFGGQIKQAGTESISILFNASYLSNLCFLTDVVLVGFPLDQTMDLSTRQADLEFYSDPAVLFSGGPAMSSAMQAVAWFELKDQDYDALSRGESELQSVLSFIQPPFDVWTETADYDTHIADMGCFHFMTGAGGFIQAIIYGLGGVRYRSDGIILKPHIPTGFSEMKLRGKYACMHTCIYRQILISFMH